MDEDNSKNETVIKDPSYYSNNSLIEFDPPSQTEMIGLFSIIGDSLGEGGMGIVAPAIFDLSKTKEIIEQPLNDIDELIEKSVSDLDKNSRDKLKIQILENTMKEVPSVFDRDRQKVMHFPESYELSENWWESYKGIYLDRALNNILDEIKENVVQKSIYFTTMHLAQPNFTDADSGDKKVIAIPAYMRVLNDKSGPAIIEENLGGIKLTWEYHEDGNSSIINASYLTEYKEVKFFEINEAILNIVGDRSVLEKSLEEVLSEAKRCIADEMNQSKIKKIPLAIKTLIPGTEISSFDAPECLISEAKSQIKASTMSNHVVPAFGYKCDGQKIPFFVMARCDGAFENAEKVDRETALEAILQSAKGLRELHNHGIFHRDMKPSQIMWSMIDGEEFYMVADFGIAKEKTQATMSMGVVKGTVAYMAPEQAAGDNHLIDQRTDTYSLCASLYSMLLGDYPFFKTFDVKQSLFSRGYHKFLKIIGKEKKKIELTEDVKKISTIRAGDTKAAKEAKATLGDVQRMDNFLEILLREAYPEASVDDENITIKGMQKYKEDRYTDDKLIEDLEFALNSKKLKHAGKNRRYRFERWRAKNSGLWRRIKEIGLATTVSALIVGGAWMYNLNTKTLGYFIDNNPISVSQSTEEQARFYNSLMQKLFEKKVKPHLDEIIRRIDKNSKESETLEEKFRESIPYLIKKKDKEWSYFAPYNTMIGTPIKKAILAYHVTGDAEFLVKAKKIAEGLELILDNPHLRAYGWSFSAAAELGEITQDKKFISMAFKAAENLKQRFNEKKGFIFPCNFAQVGKNNRKDVIDLLEIGDEIPLFFWAYKNTNGIIKQDYERMIRSTLKQIEEKMIRKTDWWKKEGLENSVHPSLVVKNSELSVSPPGYEKAGFKGKANDMLKIKADIARYHASAMQMFVVAGNVLEDEHYIDVAKDLSQFFIDRLPTSEKVLHKKEKEIILIPYISRFDLVTKEIIEQDTGATNLAALVMYSLDSKFKDVSKKMFNKVTLNYLIRDEDNTAIVKGFMANIINVSYIASPLNDLRYLQMLYLLSKKNK